MKKEELYQYIQAHYPKSFMVKDLAKRLKKNGVSRQEIKETIKWLTQKGKIRQVSKDRYERTDTVPSAAASKSSATARNANIIQGKLEAFSQGFGFVVPEKANVEDIYIPEEDMRNTLALNGDTVLVRIESRPRTGKPRGKIVKLVKRKKTQFAGIYHTDSYGSYLYPQEKRIFQPISIPRSKTLQAREGQVVIVNLLETEQKKQAYLEGEITRILGYPGDFGVDMESIIAKHGLPLEFPETVLKQAEKQSAKEIEMEGRLDYREKLVITVDPEDARDLDDAISLEKTPEGHWLLGVHIADVSHYVREGTELDKEAGSRGTSVYFPDRVIPMLPPTLSNGICSLHPEVDRLTLSCFIEYDKRGTLLKTKFAQTVIRSHARFNYDQIQEFLDGKESASFRKTYAACLTHIKQMAELALILRQKRGERCSIDFNLPEAKVILDKKGKPTGIKKEENTFSHQLIEEFMLAANTAVATHMNSKGYPFVYRIHPSPDAEKLKEFAAFLRPLGYKLKITDPMEAKEIQRLLKAAANKPEEHLINNLLLRSMQEARYSVENIGHFGLAVPFYTHFTSPIRRYPDLMVHRLLKKEIHHSLTALNKDELYRYLEDACKRCSEAERQSMEAEREAQLVKKLEYLKGHLGTEHPGVISGVMRFGVFVEIGDILVDGLIPLESLGDEEFIFLEDQYLLKGLRTKRTFRLGDSLRVKIARVNQEENKVDLELA
jgi:ribonuclease R